MLLYKDRVECGSVRFQVGDNLAQKPLLRTCVESVFGPLIPKDATRWEWTPSMHAMAVALAMAVEGNKVPEGGEYEVSFTEILSLQDVVAGLKGATIASLNNHFPDRLENAANLRVEGGRKTERRVIWQAAKGARLELSAVLRRHFTPMGGAPTVQPPARLTDGPEAVMPFSDGWADIDAFLGSERVRKAPPSTALVIDVFAMSGRSIEAFRDSFAHAPGRPKLLRVLVDALDGEVRSKLDAAAARGDARTGKVSVVIRRYPADLACWLHGNRIGFSPRWNEDRGSHVRPEVLVEPLRLYLGARRPDGPNLYDPEYDVWTPERRGAGKWFNAFDTWFLKAWRASDPLELIMP
ncbi:MAG: hypothetical protein Q8S73_10855 [Deltaproteobacteria bacterium]|nr:hypothetical protein [Myxococcales bacterium]MDP3214594.1 hypothetical protein [Deltaproteobacteria bacterium]